MATGIGRLGGVYGSYRCICRSWPFTLQALDQGLSSRRDGAGVPRSVAMKLTGHKTEAVYRQYAIADERDLKVAVERLDAMIVGL